MKKDKLIYYKKGGNLLKISSYNILSRNNTHYNWRCHRNIIPDITNFELQTSTKGEILIKKNQELESKNQTIERYSLIIKNILSEKSDIVCLQECDTFFFNLIFNPNVCMLLTQYNRVDLLDLITEDNPTASGICILVKKDNNIKHIFDPIFTPINKYGGLSKGAILLPIIDMNNNPLWIVSAHFNSDSQFRQKLVLDIEQIYESNKHPYLISINDSITKSTLLVFGDFNIEGEGAILNNRKNYMAMEFGDIPNTSKFIYPFESKWYNSKNILTNGILTGLDGGFTLEKNIDHIFVYNNSKYKFNLNILEEKHIYGPYLENDKLSERIGGKARHNQLNLKHIQTFIKSKKPPSKIVRGSDHKMLTLTIR